MTAQTLSVSALSITASFHHSKPAQSGSLALARSDSAGSLGSSLIGHKLYLRSSFLVRKQSRSAKTIFFSLPTAKPDRAPVEKIPRWTATAIRLFGMAELEAKKLMIPTLGTEGLLMGILTEGTSLASRFLHANKITLFGVREKCEELRVKDEASEQGRYFSLELDPLPLTEAAQRVLDWAVDEKIKSGDDGEVTTSHMLLGIWHEKEDLGRKVLEALGFNDEKAKELAKSLQTNKYDTMGR